MQGGDAAKLLQHLEQERDKDPDLYVESLIDAETNRLQGVFYMTSQQKELWQHYADIICNDNTAATNVYKLPLCIFVAVDNNYKSRIVAQAILPDETSNSYRWVLQQTLKATGVEPGAFMTDADPGLESIASEVYPEAYLLHCVWHIGRNIEKKLSKLLGDRYEEFLKAFYRARNVLCKETFEQYWKQLMVDYPESTDYLLRQLDPRKTTWAKAFTGSIFTAGITSTQRCESINSVIKQEVNERCQLHILFQRIERCIANQSFCSKFAAWREKTTMYTTPTVPGRLFPAICDVLQTYVTPKILQLHTDQMNEAVMYHCKKVDVSDRCTLVLVRSLSFTSGCCY